MLRDLFPYFRRAILVPSAGAAMLLFSVAPTVAQVGDPKASPQDNPAGHVGSPPDERSRDNNDSARDTDTRDTTRSASRTANNDRMRAVPRTSAPSRVITNRDQQQQGGVTQGSSLQQDQTQQQRNEPLYREATRRRSEEATSRYDRTASDEAESRTSRSRERGSADSERESASRDSSTEARERDRSDARERDTSDDREEVSFRRDETDRDADRDESRSGSRDADESREDSTEDERETRSSRRDADRERSRSRDMARDSEDEGRDESEERFDSSREARSSARDTSRDAARDSERSARETEDRSYAARRGEDRFDARDREHRYSSRDEERFDRDDYRSDRGDLRDDVRDTVRAARDTAREAGDTFRGARDTVRGTTRDVRDTFDSRDVRDTRATSRTSFDVNNVRSADVGIWFNRSTRDGLVISNLATSGPIARLGFREGDQIISVDGTRIRDEQAFVRYLFDEDIRDERVPVVVYRNGAQQTVYVQPAMLVEHYTTVQHDPLEQIGIVPDDRYYNRVVVWKVIPRTPAYYAGLQPGDVISTWDRHRLARPSDLVQIVRDARPGEVQLQVYRGRQPRQLSVEVPQLAERGSRRTAYRPSFDGTNVDVERPLEGREERIEERREMRYDNRGFAPAVRTDVETGGTLRTPAVETQPRPGALRPGGVLRGGLLPRR